MPGKDKASHDAHQNIERLVNEHAETLYAYALMRVGQRESAEDIVQETLLAALQSWQRFTGASSERTWLIGILRHKMQDFFRRNRPPGDMDQETWRSEYFDKARHWRDEMVNWQDSPQALVENHEFWQVLQGCLRELSQIMARAFIMREMEGLSCQEVCKLLDISETNLWVRLHRARLQLRRCLEVNWFV